MNKLFLVLCTLVCSPCFSSESYVGENLSGEDMLELLISNEAEDLSCGHFHGSMDYQTVAKFFEKYMFPKNPESSGCTPIFSYKKDRISGIIFRIDWFADGFIITQINGPREGYQVVFFGENIKESVAIGVSYPHNRVTEKLLNHYSWGYVCSDLEQINVYGHNPLVE